MLHLCLSLLCLDLFSLWSPYIVHRVVQSLCYLVRTLQCPLLHVYTVWVQISGFQWQTNVRIEFHRDTDLLSLWSLFSVFSFSLQSGHADVRVSLWPEKKTCSKQISEHFTDRTREKKTKPQTWPGPGESSHLGSSEPWWSLKHIIIKQVLWPFSDPWLCLHPTKWLTDIQGVNMTMTAELTGKPADPRGPGNPGHPASPWKPSVSQFASYSSNRIMMSSMMFCSHCSFCKYWTNEWMDVLMKHIHQKLIISFTKSKTNHLPGNNWCHWAHLKRLLVDHLRLTCTHHMTFY